MTGDVQIPIPINEPVYSYAPGTPERRRIKARLAEMAGERIEIPLRIGGTEVRTGKTHDTVMPHRHAHVLATVHLAGRSEVDQAIAAACQAWAEWSRWPWEERAGVFLRAAELLSTTWRDTVNAATMLGQSKTVHQAEIDSACELIDFFRFNAHFAERIYQDQPLSPPGVWNRMEYRPLEGFVYAITPFNFTSIAGNLPSAPALMGNTVLWKPALASVLSSHYLARLFEAAGLPPGVINLVPGNPVEISDAALKHAAFTGIHFTGSTAVMQQLWRTIGERIASYRSYPRIVGETGGKDFIVAHASADEDALVTALVRGAFEYQGQKCSAVSRAYIPDGLWGRIRDRLLHEVSELRMGDVADFRNFVGAVIDRKAYEKVTGYLDRVRKDTKQGDILEGGAADDVEGYFIRPTVVQAHEADYVTMREEIFGPVLTVYVYPESEWQQTLRLVDQTSAYGLTGAVFATDRRAVIEAYRELWQAAGNFYVNDKPTGAVVGQQPFGGARASGTNDKAGSMLNLVRWVSARAVKETFVPPTDYHYPFMTEA